MICAIHIINAQTVKVLTSGTKTSLRGLSVVSDKIIWASGSNGTVAKSIDAGETWRWITVKGFEKTDFRDIEAFDDKTAIIMAIDSPAYILKTINGGETWKTVYQNNTKGMFLDAMDFITGKNGIVVGDPINGRFFIATTNDGGNTWQEDAINALPIADSGEACFASSGTNIRKIDGKKYLLVSGGLKSHLFFGKNSLRLPILQGKESTGANSIAAKNNKVMMIVGGDFTTKDSTTKNCFTTTNAGKNWHAPIKPPTGYRSCIEYINKAVWITCGLNGVDLTKDNGHIFTHINDLSFHCVRKAKNGVDVFFTGNNGKIAILKW